MTPVYAQTALLSTKLLPGNSRQVFSFYLLCTTAGFGL
jgi:hypothetical protein